MRFAATVLVLATIGGATLGAGTIAKAIEQNSQEAMDAKVAAWKGQRVRLLEECCATERQQFYFGGNRSGYGDYQFHWDGKPKEGIPRSFAGKTGTIVDFTVSIPGIQYDVVIELDDSKVRIVGDGNYLGFFDEKAAAEKLIGKMLWAKGERLLTTRSGQSVMTTNLQPLTITAAEWGVGGGLPVHLFAKTNAGQEGYVDAYVDARFHTH